MSITITPQVTMVFHGAKSGKAYTLAELEPVSIEPEELTHLDPTDYVVGHVDSGKLSQARSDARFADWFSQQRWHSRRLT